MSRCEHCPIKGGPCVGESGKWTGLACKMATQGESGVRWVVERSAAPAPPAYPSLATQARNLAGAAVRFVASGLATVDQAEYDRRRDVCRACPLYDAAAQKCMRCGCMLAVKPWMQSETCPEGKW